MSLVSNYSSVCAILRQGLSVKTKAILAGQLALGILSSLLLETKITQVRVSLLPNPSPSIYMDSQI